MRLCSALKHAASLRRVALALRDFVGCEWRGFTDALGGDAPLILSRQYY